MLVLPGDEVEHLVLHHEVEVLAGLGGEGLVHLPGLLGQLLGGADGNGVAVGKDQILVVPAELLQAQPSGLLLVHLVAQGRDVEPHRLAEPGGLLGVVVVAASGQIDVVDVAVKAQLFGDGAAGLDQLPVQLVQLGRDALVELCPFPERGAALLPVGGLHVPQQPVEIALFAHELHRAGGRGLGILGGQLVLPDGGLDDGGADELFLGLLVLEHQRAVFFLQLGPEGTLQQRGGALLEDHPQLRDLGVEELHLPVVEFVLHVHGVAHMGNGPLGHGLVQHLLPFPEGRVGLLKAGRLLELLDAGQIVLLDLGHVRPDIGEISEFFHDRNSFRCFFLF